MLNLIPALRIKDVTIFDLLNQEFYQGEFLFFSQLAAYLGKVAAIPEADAREIGMLSELVYLYAKLHISLQEKSMANEGFCGSVQMPVLIGDLFLGRFYRFLAESEKEVCLPVYMDFMRQMNGQQVDGLLEHPRTESRTSFCPLLVRKTAEAMAVFAGAQADMQQTLETAAEQYRQQHWDSVQGRQVTSLSALEECLQAEEI